MFELLKDLNWRWIFCAVNFGLALVVLVAFLVS